MEIYGPLNPPGSDAFVASKRSWKLQQIRQIENSVRIFFYIQTVEGVAITKAVTEKLTSEQVQLWAKQGLTKEWVQKQLASYTNAIQKGLEKAGQAGANPLNNKQLLPRKELMEKILELWK